MKIALIAANDHPGTQGGVSTFNRNISEIFSNEEIYILAYKTRNEKIYTENIKNLIEFYPKNKKIRRIDRKFFKFKLQNFLLKREIKKLKPEICIFNSFNDIEILKEYNCKKILVQHIGFDYLEEVYGKDKDKLKEIINQVDKFVCLSIYDKNRFVREMNLDEKKIEVIHHTSKVKIRQNNKKKNKKLIMIARLENKTKRFDLVIKAMKRLPEYTLDIYGAGSRSDKKEIEKFILEAKVNNVMLHGSTNKIEEKLDEAGIYIMTSDYEGYPISLIESIRRKVPIVLRKTFDAASDIIENNGILLEKDWNEDKFVKAIEKIYENYDYYSENSVKLVSKYDFDEVKYRWSGLIEKIKN